MIKVKAVVLSGGGSKGSYQIGVWKALQKLHIKYDIVTGTSVGALNGALMVQNNYKKALKLWRKINLKVLFGEDATTSKKTLDIYKMYGKNFIKNGGMNIKDLEELVEKTLNKQKFYSSKINYGLITYNLSKRKAKELTKKEIKEKQLVDYLIASATCFPAFKQKEIEGLKYIDGGYYDNLPINLAIQMGADEIIAVDLRAPGIKKTAKKKVKITTIKPKNKLTNFLNFYEEGSKRNMKFGYNDTMKAFKKLEGKKYTFKKNSIQKNRDKHQDLYKDTLKKVLRSKKMINNFKEIYKAGPDITEEMKNTIFLTIMETTARSFDLEETKIYSYRNFNRQIKRKVKEKMKPYQKNPNRKIRKKELYLYQSLINQNYKELHKLILIHPLEVLKAIYIYTICEN